MTELAQLSVEQAEAAIVGMMLAFPDSVPAHLVGKLIADDFGDPIFRAAAEFILGAAERRESFTDVVAVKSAACKACPDVPPSEVADRLVAAVSDPLPGHHADDVLPIVRNAAARRRIAVAASEMKIVAQAGDLRPPLEAVEEIMRDLRLTFDDDGTQDVDAGVAVVEALQASHGGKSAKRLTSVGVIDSVLGGFAIGSLNVVAARPGGGKSTFGLHLCVRYAMAGGTAGFVSMEMSRNEVALVIAANSANVSHSKLIAGEISQDDFDRVAAAYDRVLAQKRIHLVIAPRLTLPKLAARIRSLVKVRRCSIVVVDYLQLIRVPRSRRDQRRDQEIGEVSRELKALAGELEISIVALAQLNREIEREKTPRYPRMSDLRESGDIENDSDSIAFLAKPVADDDDQPDFLPTNVERCAFVVAKHRHGKTGISISTWDKDRRRFHEAE